MKLTLKSLGISPTNVIFALACAAIAGPVQAEVDFIFPPAHIASVKPAAMEVANTNDKSPQRQVASSGKDLNESSLSKELREFRDQKILKITSPDQIDALIAEVNAKYETYPDDLKLVATGISMLKPLKGILFRSRPFVEKTRTLHSAVLSAVRKNLTRFHTFFPGTQWDAVIAYIGKLPDSGAAQFMTEVDIQRYLASEVYPELMRAADRIESLSVREPIVFDNKILYGTASFQSDLDRYRTFSAPEKLAALAEIHEDMAKVSVLLAYRWNDFLKVHQSLGMLYGIDGFRGMFEGGVEGAPARDRVAKIKEYKDFLTLRDRGNPNGKGYAAMAEAFKQMNLSVQNSNRLWDAVKKLPADYQAFVDPGSLNFKTRQIPLGIDTRIKLMKGPTPIVSAITGEAITVDLKKFFTSPPDDLKDFLATGFQDGPRETSDLFAGKSVKLRNYFEGSPTAWNLPAYHKYISGVNSNADVPKSVRILGQAWGGDGMAAILTHFVQ